MMNPAEHLEGAMVRLDEARDSPVTQRRWFRWWMAVPVLLFVVCAWRHEIGAMLFPMKAAVVDVGSSYNGSGGGADSAAAPAEAAMDLDKIVAVFERLIDALAKLVSILGALGWVYVRGKPKEAPAGG